MQSGATSYRRLLGGHFDLETGILETDIFEVNYLLGDKRHDLINYIHVSKSKALPIQSLVVLKISIEAYITVHFCNSKMA